MIIYIYIYILDVIEKRCEEEFEIPEARKFPIGFCPISDRLPIELSPKMSRKKSMPISNDLKKHPMIKINSKGIFYSV